MASSLFVFLSFHGEERTRKQESDALDSGLSFTITLLCDLGRATRHLCFLTHERGASNDLLGGFQLSTASDYVILLATQA